MTSALEAARTAFTQQAWRDACRAFQAAAAELPLEPDDYEHLAVAAYLTGEDRQCVQAWEAAHRAALHVGDDAGAARAAVLLALCLMLRGDMAQAGGWLGRAEGLVEHASVECAASGYVLIPKVLGALEVDPALAADLAMQAAAIAKRCGDDDLLALAVLGHGQALIGLGETRTGIARLDDVMVSVAGRDVGPVVTGIVYCAVIIECLKLYDWARASEWTAALNDWCEGQPDLVPYRGQCLIHRSQLHQAAGRWSDALASAEAACRHLGDPPHPALGLAHYQAGEINRLLGALDRAEEAYRAASRHGLDPVPGLALLELARDDAEAAARTIRRALRETPSPQARPPLLAAAIAILRAAGDLEGARQASEELAATAGASDSAVLAAMASFARGTVLVAEGDPVAALPELRIAARHWHALAMPYEAARTAVAVGLACAAVGDLASAALELDNARAVFATLGARPDLDRLAGFGDLLSESGLRGHDTRPTLSAREAEVLAQLAAGKTNREIAEILTISQHTVGRHVENIFSKLGVTTRAAATAYAYENGLLTDRTA